MQFATTCLYRKGKSAPLLDFGLAFGTYPTIHSGHACYLTFNKRLSSLNGSGFKTRSGPVELGCQGAFGVRVKCHHRGLRSAVRRPEGGLLPPHMAPARGLSDSLPTAAVACLLPARDRFSALDRRVRSGKPHLWRRITPSNSSPRGTRKWHPMVVRTVTGRCDPRLVLRASGPIASQPQRQRKRRPSLQPPQMREEGKPFSSKILHLPSAYHAMLNVA